MPSKQAPYLSLVWPPRDLVEDPDAFLSMQATALRRDGWRSVSLDDLRMLPANAWVELVSIRTRRNGQEVIHSFWMREMPLMSRGSCTP